MASGLACYRTVGWARSTSPILALCAVAFLECPKACILWKGMSHEFANLHQVMSNFHSKEGTVPEMYRNIYAWLATLGVSIRR